MKKLSTKIWGLIVLFLLVTITFMYVLTEYLYEQLYVEDTETTMIEVGEKLLTKYKGGKVTDQFIEEVEEFNTYSNFDVFAVRNPRELSACVPFEIDYDALIGPNERKELLLGNAVTKIGYEERFERQIISVIMPLTDQNRLEGIIYLYYPLAKISELANKDVFMIIGCAIIFSALLGFFVYEGIRHIMRPLNDLQQAVEKMSDGHYETRVTVTSKDEIGKLSEAFNEMAASIEREDEAQKNFLATVSHELRTPISYMKGYSEAILQNFIDGKEKEEAISLIAREANRMERLTNELLELARTSNEQKFELYPIVLAETIRDAISLLEQKSVEKNIEITTSFDEEIIVEGHEEKLKQIFINTIENAIRYSNNDSTISILTKIVKGNAIIEIIDRGIGIPEKDLPHITERFYRVNKARSRSDGGSGLGLSIVDQLVKQHQGSIKIKSELGKGTTVSISIPLMEE
ncbi:sensor histidine kinase [Ureibacillus endophyticus]|uniref:histidine kinase n=1 Tax=Ureibacillus endophyticus TaxID=1978490 RepID=A0A494Z184_9BACL|nr:HAMP domain-containing sensor histidine kinase [Lysinibacillus endophyticus]RKQ16225.1 sensor histidine kinase [Lysinibacillus endophyticus]